MVGLVVRRLDRVEVLVEARLPLRGLAGDESVEVVEAVPGRPAVEGPHRRRLGGRRVVPLAERRRGVAVVLQDFGHGRGVLADHAGVAVPIDGTFGDRAGMHAVVVATGQQGSTCRRADRGRVKGVVRKTRLELPAGMRGC